MSDKAKAIKEFYESLGVAKVNKKHLENETLHKLYKLPKKDKKGEIVHWDCYKKNAIHQADILFLPDDNGYKYCLVVCDVASNTTDAEPLKTKNSSEVLKAIQTIYKRKYLDEVTYELCVDAGSEFTGPFKEYFEKKGIILKVSQPSRHRQTAVVESKNKMIGKALLMRQTGQEMQTGEPSTEWTEFLSSVIKAINKKLSHVVNKEPEKKAPIITSPILDKGTKVRIQLDAPKDVASGKRLHGGFRASDPRWSIKIYTIESPLITENKNVLYSIEGIQHTAFTRNQLQEVSPNEQQPPESIIRKFIPEKLLDKKKINNRISYLVKWKHYDRTNWETRIKLLEIAPDLVKDYEKK